MAAEAEGCIEQRLTRAAQQAVEALAGANLTVVTAESCTGGLIAGVLSCAPRAGQCLQGAFVAYSKLQKQLALGISAELLQRRGSVNRAVALQMAEGALQRSGAQIALSVTGVLGPDADEDGNPAGLVYLAVAQRAQRAVVVEECITRGSPDEVRRRVVLRALELLRGAAA
ncbi:MAG TPA: CinA family protein [Steroidobacteraceae bacterium]|nr:CinA family protein [Steroidobacteraceae bacterium]